MAADAMVFAMANPTPEVTPEEAEPYARIIATGRSDYPNQINNVLCFPGIFRGALDVRAREITEEMKMAAARGIAAVVREDELREDHIIPSPFNRDVPKAVADAVAEQAKREGSAVADPGRAATRPATRRSSGRCGSDPRLAARRTPRMSVTMTGATGRLGTMISAALRERGDDVTILSRSADKGVQWDPMHGPAPATALSGRDAVIHLAGEDIAQRWNADTLRRIRESREVGTRNLVEGMRAADAGAQDADQRLRGRLLRQPPRPDRRGRQAGRRRPRPRSASPGSGRRSEAEEFGTRVVRVRTGVVLDRHGGALEKMLLPFRLGVGGPVAGGRQPLPWIHVEDVVGIYLRRARRRQLDRTGQRHSARAGHQPAVLQGPRPRAAPPGDRARARVRHPARCTAAWRSS